MRTWALLHESCAKPGSVSSSVRVLPPDARPGLQHQHLEPGPGQVCRADQRVVPRADHDHLGAGRQLGPRSWPPPWSQAGRSPQPFASLGPRVGAPRRADAVTPDNELRPRCLTRVAPVTRLTKPQSIAASSRRKHVPRLDSPRLEGRGADRRRWSLGLAACGNDELERRRWLATTRRIGASLPLTGDFSQPGEAAKQGYEVWQEMVNADGGLLGREVKLMIKDDAIQPEHDRRPTTTR